MWNGRLCHLQGTRYDIEIVPESWKHILRGLSYKGDMCIVPCSTALYMWFIDTILKEIYFCSQVDKSSSEVHRPMDSRRRRVIMLPRQSVIKNDCTSQTVQSQFVSKQNDIRALVVRDVSVSLLQEMGIVFAKTAVYTQVVVRVDSTVALRHCVLLVSADLWWDYTETLPKCGKCQRQPAFGENKILSCIYKEAGITVHMILCQPKFWQCAGSTCFI